MASISSCPVARVIDDGLKNLTLTANDHNEASKDNNSGSACTAAMGTAELLDNILSNLDFKTLLLAQRVSKTWQTRIEDNKDLQKKLFREPATFEELAALNCLDETTVVLVFDDKDAHSRVRVLNPLVTRVTCFRPQGPPGEWPLSIIGLSAGVRRDIKHGDSKEPSWHGMWFTQPPHSCIGLETKAGPAIHGRAHCAEGGTIDIYLGECGSQQMGQMVKATEKQVIELGHSVNWESFDMSMTETPMTYGKYVSHTASLLANTKVQDPDTEHSTSSLRKAAVDITKGVINGPGDEPLKIELRSDLGYKWFAF